MVLLSLYVLSAIVTGLAWSLSKKVPEHRPVAIMLSIGLGADIATPAIGLYFRRLGLPVDARWTGFPRIMGHVSDAVLLAWPAAVAACSVAVFLGRRPWPVVAGYLLTVTALVVLHPIAGDGSLETALRAANIVGVACGVISAATWYLRTEPKGTRANSAQAVLFLVLAIELASLAGAWRLGIFAHWNLSRLAYATLYVLLILLQGGRLWSNPSTRSS